MSAEEEPAASTDDAMPWYGLRVRSRSEPLCAAALRCRGYDPFVPSYKVRRRWSDRWKEVEQPLFPGYVFCRLRSTNRLPVLTSPGVIEIVGIGKVPAPIEESEIEAVRAVVASGLPSRPSPYIRTGDQVKVSSGPLRGVEGVVASVDNRRSLVVSITLLLRSVAVKLDESWVETVH